MRFYGLWSRLRQRYGGENLSTRGGCSKQLDATFVFWNLSRLDLESQVATPAIVRPIIYAVGR
jgi:hypothetical protein